MDHVVVTIYPFIMRQEVSAYKNGECIKHISCKTMKEVPEVCYALCKEYDIHKIDLAGIKEYCTRVKENICTATDYDNNFEIEFNFY